jgi:transposase
MKPLNLDRSCENLRRCEAPVRAKLDCGFPISLGRVKTILLAAWKSTPNNLLKSNYFCLASAANLAVVYAILYVAKNGCKWRALPSRFGNGHTIYTRINRWAKASVLDRLFEKRQVDQLIRIKIESVSLDSTIVKVHLDGTSALKQNGPTSDRQIPRRHTHLMPWH